MMDHLPADEPERPVPVLSRRVQWQLAAALVVLVAAGGWLAPRMLGLDGDPVPAPPPASSDGSFSATQAQWDTLRFATVQTGPLGDATQSDGKIAVDDDLTTPVISPFTGQVTRVFAKAGDRVHAGQPLFAVAANEAAQSEADIMTAAAAVKVAQANAARLHDLAANKGAALKDAQQADADLAAAQGNLLAAQGRRRALGSVSHGEGIVRAPVGGVVTQRLIGMGQNVASATGGAATQAFTISDFSRVWLVGNLREEDAGLARLGQVALVRLPDGTTLRAPLTYVAPMIDPATRRLIVRAQIANPDGRLKPETYVSFALETGGARQGLFVPEEAVIFEGDTARVWVADMRRHSLTLRPIGTGQVGGGIVEVTSGLKPGETVVTAGSLFIDRGAKAD